ncbi:MAG: peptide ligase PGM1-related protein [Actinomycetota bacterium]
MSPTAQNVEFDRRQRAFVERLRGRGLETLERGTIVVVPSISFKESELRKIVGITFYEERMLFVLLWLRHPELRIIFVTSLPVDPVIVDYYLSFLDDPASARRRLQMISLDDPRPCALSAKLLEHAGVLDSLREDPGGRDDAYILPFNVTPWERDISDHIRTPLYGPSPESVPLGSKSGSRRVAREAKVPVLPGREDLFSVAELEEAVTQLRAEEPGLETVVLKLNLGFSGQGNAVIELEDLRAPLTASGTVFCAEEETWASYASKIAAEGAIVEQLARDPRLISPSVQLRVVPGGLVEIVSTHDQILGGPDDQVYLGCRFPAGSDYRKDIMEHGRSVADVLGSVGVIGSFGIDFVGVPDGAGYDLHLGEINLRMGGTTHPFLMARMVTDGRLDENTGELVAGGRSKHYVASDNLKSERYRAYTPERAIDVLERRGLAFSRRSRTGATLHLLGALRPFGKLGTVCIADSAEEADALYDEVSAVLETEA